MRFAFCAQEERQALRLFLRALRRLPDDARWEATVFSPTGAAPTGALRSRLRDRLTLLSADDTDESEVLANADVVVAASLGHAPAPGLLVRALGAGAVPVAARLPAYEEVLGDGELGLLFEPGDVDVLAGQLERARARPGDRRRLRERAAAATATSPGAASPTRPRRSTASSPRCAAPAAGLKPEVRERLASRPLIDVDLHMHTDHSNDCVTPVEVLLATARERGLGAIAVTDHNEISGAHEAREKAAEYGVKVIVGEEVKTADQGEVIGLFIEEKIPRGMSLEETIAEIRRQGGLVYVPHPFDRLHSVPDYEHLLARGRRRRRDRDLQPADRDRRLERGGGALRRQVPDPRRRRVGRARRPGPRRRADPDARLRRAGGVPRVAARRRHPRAALVAALRAGAGAEVPRDARHPGGRPAGGSAAARQARGRRSRRAMTDAGARRTARRA